MDTVPHGASSPLLPRYRGAATFGKTLDDTVLIFRGNWLRMAAVMAIGAIPYAVLVTGIAALGITSNAALQTALSPTGGFTSTPQFTAAIQRAVGAGLVAGLLFVLFVLAVEASVVALTAWLMHGQERSVGSALGAGFGRLVPLVLGALLLAVGVVLLYIVSFVLMVVTIGGIFLLVPLVVLVVWLANPGARRPWLKWLLILTTPFGIVAYFTVRWSLYVPYVVLERQGPMQALRNSSHLVSGQWFRVAGTEVVLGVITVVLEYIPILLVTGIGTAVLIGQAATGTTSQPLAVQIFANLGGAIGQVLFGSIAFIGLTVLFTDLRNQREGADLGEQLNRLDLDATGAL